MHVHACYHVRVPERLFVGDKPKGACACVR